MRATIPLSCAALLALAAAGCAPGAPEHGDAASDAAGEVDAPLAAAPLGPAIAAPHGPAIADPVPPGARVAALAHEVAHRPTPVRIGGETRSAEAEVAPDPRPTELEATSEELDDDELPCARGKLPPGSVLASDGGVYRVDRDALVIHHARQGGPSVAVPAPGLAWLGHLTTVAVTPRWLALYDLEAGVIAATSDLGRTFVVQNLPECRNAGCDVVVEDDGAIDFMTGAEAGCGGGYQERFVGHLRGGGFQTAPWPWDSPLSWRLLPGGWALGVCERSDLPETVQALDERRYGTPCAVHLSGRRAYFPGASEPAGDEAVIFYDRGMVWLNGTLWRVTRDIGRRLFSLP